MKQKSLTESEYLQRIKELEEALEYERLRNYAYEKLIEITEKEEGITILKKAISRTRNSINYINLLPLVSKLIEFGHQSQWVCPSISMGLGDKVIEIDFQT